MRPIGEDSLLGYRWRWGFLIPSKSLQRSEVSRLDPWLMGDGRRARAEIVTQTTARLSTYRPIVPVLFLALSRR